MKAARLLKFLVNSAWMLPANTPFRQAYELPCVASFDLSGCPIARGGRYKAGKSAT